MGISPALAGRQTFFVAALIGTLSGLLVAPLTTIYYDSGFLIGLKGFVAAIIGGLASYPLAAGWRHRRRPARILLFLLGQCLQGCAGVHADHSGPRSGCPSRHIMSRRRITAHVVTTSSAGKGWISPRLLPWRFSFSSCSLRRWLLPEFYVTLLNYVGLSALVALGLVLLTGVGGLTSFGQAAFVGLGAYTTAWLTDRQRTAGRGSSFAAGSPWMALVRRPAASPQRWRSSSAR